MQQEKKGRRTFYGIRPNPPQEYKEKGWTNGPELPDYEGIIFSDGKVVIVWQTNAHSISIFDDYDQFLLIHGHPEYGTMIVFDG